MSADIAVYITNNFESNLDEIEDYLELNDGSYLYIPLLDELFSRIIPNIERFPDMGVEFLSGAINSIEAINQIEMIQARLASGAEIREYIFGHYILLYLHDNNAVYLLSIKHHRQLSYNF